MKTKRKLFKDLRALELFRLDLEDFGFREETKQRWGSELFIALKPYPRMFQQYLAMRISTGDIWLFERRSVIRSLRKKLGMEKFGKHEKTLGESAVTWISTL